MFKRKSKIAKEEKEKNSERVLMLAQIKRMVQFMELEGQDRAAHLEERAEEEFHITKGQLINHERRIIAIQYEKKLAKLVSDTNTEISKMRNKGRLEAFKEKAILVDDIVKEIKKKIIKELESDRLLYLVFLENLYLQALCMLMKDGKIEVTVREKEKALVSDILTNVAGEFRKLTGKTINPEVNSETFLGEDSLGGALFTSGRVSVSSTIMQRIEDLVLRAMPFIRSSLFGVNVRRKFYI